MKMRLRVRTGDECPGGSGVFHTTFFSGPNSVGSPEVVETPVPLGPRNCAHSSAATMIDDDAINAAINRAKRMCLIFDIETFKGNFGRLDDIAGWILVDGGGKRKAPYVPIHSFMRFGSRPIIGVIVSRGTVGGVTRIVATCRAQHLSPTAPG